MWEVFSASGYSKIEKNEAGVWLGMKFTETKAWEIHGGKRVDNLSMHFIRYRCGTTPITASHLLPRLKAIIDANPAAQPFKDLPVNNIGKLCTKEKDFTDALAKLEKRIAAYTETKTPMEPPALMATAAWDLENEEAELLPSNGVDVLSAELAPVALQPLVALEVSQDDWLSVLADMKIKSPANGRHIELDFDFSVRVYRPANHHKKNTITYRIILGAFLRDVGLNYRTIYAGAGNMGGEWRLFLMLDNTYFEKNAAKIPSTAGKMSNSFNNNFLGELLVKEGKLVVSQVVDTVTIFKWDLQPIKIHNTAAEANKNFVLTNLRREVKNQDEV